MAVKQGRGVIEMVDIDGIRELAGKIYDGDKEGMDEIVLANEILELFGSLNEPKSESEIMRNIIKSTQHIQDDVDMVQISCRKQFIELERAIERNHSLKSVHTEGSRERAHSIDLVDGAYYGFIECAVRTIKGVE